MTQKERRGRQEGEQKINKKKFFLTFSSSKFESKSEKYFLTLSNSSVSVSLRRLYVLGSVRAVCACMRDKESCVRDEVCVCCESNSSDNNTQ